MKFYPVRPHSLHISLQLPKDHAADLDAALPLSVMKCLFAILGDPRRCVDGKVRLVRLLGGEIVSPPPAPAMLFSSISRRHSHWNEDDEAIGEVPQAPLVQQYKFMRLSPHVNYEPVAVVLKGLQLTYEPGNFLTPQQYKTNPRLRELFDRLVAWAPSRPRWRRGKCKSSSVLSAPACSRSRDGQPAHGLAYIGYCLDYLSQAASVVQRAPERLRIGGKRWNSDRCLPPCDGD